jgi:hypothetical protein
MYMDDANCFQEVNIDQMCSMATMSSGDKRRRL